LEEHPNDSHHGKAAIVDLSQQALLLLHRIIDGLAPWQAKGAIALIVTSVLARDALQVEDLNDAHKGDDLKPACPWNQWDALEASGDVRKHDFGCRRYVPWELVVLRDDVAKAG